MTEKSIEKRIEELRRRGKFLGKLYFLIGLLAILFFGIAVIYMLGSNSDFGDNLLKLNFIFSGE